MKYPRNCAPTTTPPTAFAERLRHYRELYGRSQSQLAKRAGVDHSYISRLESGLRPPTRAAIERLVVALGSDDKERRLLFASAGFLPEKPQMSSAVGVDEGGLPWGER